MKADEAPEKLYIDSREHWRKSWTAFRLKAKSDDIEYIRTDVFIKKACKFLKSYRQDTLDGLGYIPGIVNDKTIEDFRKYIEGE